TRAAAAPAMSSPTIVNHLLPIDIFSSSSVESSSRWRFGSPSHRPLGKPPSRQQSPQPAPREHAAYAAERSCPQLADEHGEDQDGPRDQALVVLAAVREIHPVLKTRHHRAAENAPPQAPAAAADRRPADYGCCDRLELVAKGDLRLPDRRPRPDDHAP